MRVAALYDIHGNLPALEAALADVERLGVDAIVVGGDVALGPMPRETLERLLALGGAVRWVRGNADRELVSPAANGDGVWRLRSAWAAGQLTSAHRDLLRGLPTTLTVEIEGLGPTLFCHGSPRSDEEIITSASPDERLLPMLASVTERVVVCGHTHVQFDRVAKHTRIVNAGSVGMPYEGSPGAYWALLGPGVSLRRTSYDVEAAAERIRSTAYPEPDELLSDLFESPVPAAEATGAFERMAADRERVD